MHKLAIAEMIDIFQDDAKRINHALKVFGFAEAIAASESVDPETTEVIAVTSILHDIGIKECERKYGKSTWECQETEGPGMAEKIMDKLGISRTVQDRVCFIIGNHHTYENIDGIDFQIIIEADFIVNACEKNMDKKAIRNFVETWFKTDSGKEIITKMYLSGEDSSTGHLPEKS